MTIPNNSLLFKNKKSLAVGCSKEENESQEKFPEKNETLENEESLNCFAWKKELPFVIRSGNIDRLEELMEMEDFDINTTWFQENLLMIAIRARQSEMAEFLIDNGINYHFTRTILDYQKPSNEIHCYTISCRQMAYDHRMPEIVHLIDDKSQQLFSFIKPRQRTPRIHQSKKSSTGPCVESADLILEVPREARSESQTLFRKSKPSLSDCYNSGLNLHRFTPDLILFERKKGLQGIWPLNWDSPKSIGIRNCSRPSSDDDGKILLPISNPNFAIHSQKNFSGSLFPKKPTESGNLSKNRPTTSGGWNLRENSGRLTRIEKESSKPNCWDSISKRVPLQVLPNKNEATFCFFKNSSKWSKRPKSWIP